MKLQGKYNLHMPCDKVKAFIQLTRPLFLGGAVLLYLLGAALAWAQGTAIDWSPPAVGTTARHVDSIDDALCQRILRLRGRCGDRLGAHAVFGRQRHPGQRPTRSSRGAARDSHVPDQRRHHGDRVRTALAAHVDHRHAGFTGRLLLLCAAGEVGRQRLGRVGHLDLNGCARAFDWLCDAGGIISIRSCCRSARRSC